MHLEDEHTRQAFKIKDPFGSEFVYEYHPERETVTMWNVTPGVDKHKISTLKGKFPFACINAYQYFV